jgi:hypothetical protein
MFLIDLNVTIQGIPWGSAAGTSAPGQSVGMCVGNNSLLWGLGESDPFVPPVITTPPRFTGGDVWSGYDRGDVRGSERE